MVQNSKKSYKNEGEKSRKTPECQKIKENHLENQEFYPQTMENHPKIIPKPRKSTRNLRFNGKYYQNQRVPPYIKLCHFFPMFSFPAGLSEIDHILRTWAMKILGSLPLGLDHQIHALR